MFRLLALVSVLVVCVVACGSETPSPTAGTDLVWLTAPQNTEQRREVMQRARNIDVCALLPRDELGKVGEVTSVKTTDTYTCKAVLDAADPSDGTMVKWQVLMDPPPQEGVLLPGAVSTLGDVSVRTVIDRGRSGVDPAELRERTCSLTATYPSTAELYLEVVTRPDTDPCPIAQTLLPIGLARWAAEPEPGSSPDTAVTALTGQDPCAVVDSLNGATLAEVQLLWNCYFTYQGDDIVVDYKYQLEGSATIEQPLVFTVADHPVHLFDGGEGYRTYNSIVGPPLYAGGESSFLGTEVPMVSVHGTNAAALEDVMRRILESLPKR
ncbi:hypothetical protein B0T44_01945 [Nocardia donostiensis]|uniref:DUF5642 domain-containing protein n=1 Tax=Nocardia donostiensis TaxID=1538463 RepID=A0A1W0B006_9NOCA|nr:hypothetical protein B0T46_03410 [Nocardia donostiensis]OQS15808.1 hypothetical protein B0T36_07505 [Nocardia donostiensis]OQS23613.1 hypothetical protein B0T44_01945 [Nocardia donostiensis]